MQEVKEGKEIMKFKQILALVFAIALGYGAGQQGGKLWATDYPTGGGVGVHPVNLASDVTGELPHASTSNDAAQVHGLGASVNVLGNLAASAEFVQRDEAVGGTFSTTDLPVYFDDTADTYATAYSAAPRVVTGGGGNADLIGTTAVSITTTGFTMRSYGITSGGAAITAEWISLGN